MDEGRYLALSVDYAETIPDVIWPVSNITYSMMRNDPAVSAVLSAITLPIRRATWAVDPAGCRPKIAQMVADDLGLPVLGVSKPTAARTRGVSWPEHLRAALMYLVYGHAAFEMLADVSSGMARLVGLYERVQHTISFIHSTPDGDFGGISQFYHPDRKEAPEIGADRMVFYSHSREGSAWHGRSLLRPMYASFLLKREAQRILATSSRRFGMGVPTVEWVPGATPTPAQMTAAQQAASAARVGDESGLALPPGATLVLKGLTGGTPDVLAFIKWLDQQISKSALAQFLDLGGESSHGSRALGTAFVDLFTLAITAAAEEVADQATRQAAARIVEWNFGPDEPVPSVVVTDIGTKHEITADALLQLMQAGAITADPALEEYVRKAYQLPQRSTPWAPPARPKGASTSGPGLLGDSGVGDANTVAAAAKPPARPRRRRQPATGQLALPIAAADDTEPDPAAEQKDAAQHQHAWERTRAQVLADWPDVAQPMVDDLAQQAADASASGDLSELATITVSAAVLAGLVAALTPPLLALAAESAGHVLADAKAHGVTVRKPKAPGAGKAGQVAEVTASLIATGYAQAATRKAMQVAGGTAEDVRAAVESTLTDMGGSAAGLVADQVGAGLTAAQAAGRSAAFAAAGKKIAGWRASETLDSNTCEPCREISQTVFATLAEVEAAYGGAGGYSGCLGGLRCRGFARAIWK
jgi:hypothetical protein